jgi:hypothetical protein
VVLNVTVTNMPVVVEPVTITYNDVTSNWTAAFPCGDGGQVYQVVSTSIGTRQPSVRGVRDVDWASPVNTADYVILIPPEGWRDGFRQAMQPLADYRNAQGLRTVIVDVESLYNHYSHGLVDPQAIRNFCMDGHTVWSDHPLRYLLLAGAGAVDFKHLRLSVSDYTACLIPTLITNQTFPGTGEGMTVAVDAKFGDVNNDNVPEVMIGRMPTTKTQELTVAVRKTIAYEGGLLWKQQVSLAADWDNTVGSVKYHSFTGGTDLLVVPLAAAGRTVVKHYPIDDTGNMKTVRTNSLFPALRAGSGLFHFFGHSNEVNLGFKTDEPGRLLHYTHISRTNWQKPTIAVLICCLANRWHSPYYTTTNSVVPYGLFADDTGFVAGLGATGYMLAEEGETLAVNLYMDAAEQGTLRLGDFWRRGLQSMAGTMPPERLQCYSLVGDPTLVMRHDISSTGTPVSWLVDHGLTAPNADLDDPDLDGWASWQEHRAGTNPTNFVLRITDARMAEEVDRRTIAFEAASNRTYQVEHTGSLMATDDWHAVSWAWTNATEWAVPGTAIAPQGPISTVAVPASNVATQGFYQIRRLD